MSPARRSKSSASADAAPPAQAVAATSGAPTGRAEAPEAAPAPVRPLSHPTALIQSLGTPPLPNAGVAQHYFEAIYERAAALAIALATSAGLAETTPSD